MSRLKSKVAFITGASRGIGRAVAQAYVREGARVALVATRKANVQRMCDELSLPTDQVLCLGADVSKREQVQQAVQDTPEVTLLAPAELKTLERGRARVTATLADGRVIRFMAGPNGSIQGPCEAKWGYTTLSVADWDGDGLPDLIVNSIWGKVVWFKNVGTRRAPRLAAAQPIEVEWDGAQPALGPVTPVERDAARHQPACRDRADRKSVV